MDYRKLIRWSGLLNIFVSVLFLVWWVMLGVLTLASGTLNLSSLALVRLNGYQLQSVLGLAACILAPFGMLGLYLPHAEKLGKLGLAGFLLSSTGLALYACMQFDETFTWPVLALKAPSVLESGGLLSDPAWFFIFIFMGGVLALGFILFGSAHRRLHAFPSWSVAFFSLGAVLFGIGMATPIRTLGLVLWVTGWARMGYLLWKEKVL